MYWQLAGIFTVTFVIIIISDFCVSCLQIHIPCIYIHLCIDTYCLVDIEIDCRHAESLGAQMLRLSHRPGWRGSDYITVAKVNSCNMWPENTLPKVQPDEWQLPATGWCYLEAFLQWSHIACWVSGQISCPSSRSFQETKKIIIAKYNMEMLTSLMVGQNSNR